MKKYSVKMFFVFFVIFLFVFVSKASAELLFIDANGPEDNTITTMGGVDSVKFNIKFTVVSEGISNKDKIETVLFQPSVDGVPVKYSGNGKYIIWSGKHSDFDGQTITRSWTDEIKHPTDSKKYTWKLTDDTGKIEYINKSFTYKTYSGDSGFYYIYKHQSGSDSNPIYVFEYSTKFNDLVSCITDSQNISVKDIKSVLYKECVQYDYLPNLTTNEYENISSTKKPNDSTNDSYKLLAPLNGTTEIKTNSIGDYINTIIKIIIGICAALAVIMIILAGIQWMGDESVFGKTEAKGKIGAAILGLIIALGSYALLNTINPDLLGKNGLSISTADIEIENEPLPWSTYEKGDNKTACPQGFVDVPTGASPANINVCSIIATDLSNLLAAAKKDGYTLSGSGSRSIATTQALRVKNNCPKLTDKCTPNAVAAPGASNHEKGLAVDFNCNGVSMVPDKTNKNNVCYIWLSKNAATYHFLNKFDLIKETWHWSTTGT